MLRPAFLFVAVTLLATASAQFVVNTAQYEQELVHGEQDLRDDLNPEVVERITSYREASPSPSDYRITLLVNPCGANGTHGGLGGSPLAFDCCVGSYGAGEYALIDPGAQIFGPQGEPFIKGLQISPWSQLALPDEVFHNIKLVDEDFNPIPLQDSRRAADETTIDPRCNRLRSPLSDCLDYRSRAVKSNLRPACSDNNQTVDATLDFYTPDGQRNANCMQVGYAQTALIHQCGGIFADHPDCGTFLEIHRESPYDDENTILAETRITGRGDGTTSTTIVPLTYKADPTRILCNYQESKIRVGSMVRINSNAAVCCCPPTYRDSTKRGSFFCPRRPGWRDGPMATKPETLEEQLAVDDHEAAYPLCHNHDEDKDVLMCSKPLSAPFATHGAYTYPCGEVTLGDDGRYGSVDLDGRYDGICSIGEAFAPCSKAFEGTIECVEGDRRMSFRDEIGKVVGIVYDDDDSEKDIYQVSFNDGRTQYSFALHDLDMINLDNTFSLWYVQRNRFEKVVKKKKDFRVIWPPCSFDSVNNQFFPYAQLDESGKPMAVVELYDGVME